MEYRIRTKTGQVYRVPEDIYPHIAQAMVSGGTADKVEEKSTLPQRLMAETASVLGGAQKAAISFLKPSPKVNLIGKKLRSGVI